MNELVERVAREMVAAETRLGLEEGDIDGIGRDVGRRDLVDAVRNHPDAWKAYVELARAVLAVIREPTPAMVRAAAQAGDPLASDEPPGRRADAADAWRAMVDEALR